MALGCFDKNSSGNFSPSPKRQYSSCTLILAKSESFPGVNWPGSDSGGHCCATAGSPVCAGVTLGATASKAVQLQGCRVLHLD